LCKDRNDYYRRRGSTNLVIAGTICETKGQQDAILAVKELLRREREVELIIVGYSNAGYLETLRDLVKSEKLEDFIRFYDFRENVYPIMSQADIVLVCSGNEAFGRVTLEAMILGKPVVSTNSGGTPELIKEGFNGLLYEPGDYKQLADRIEYLIENKGKIKEFGENGHRYAKEFFTKEEYGGRVYELLTSIKKDGNPASSSDTLSNLIKNMEPQIFDFNKRINQSNAQLSYLEGKVKEKEATLNHIYNSHSWKPLLIYYKLIDKFLPIDTKRRLLAKVIFWTILRPGEVFKNLNKTNLKKFFYFFRVAEPSVLEEEIEKKISVAPPKSEVRRIEVKFDENITLEKIEYLNFPSYEQPVVSIIIPAWNKWQYTVNCLKSISENTASNYEVIVVNDASQDETATVLSKVKNLRLINNKDNMGFIESCNLGAKAAKGDYILFLNNDTMVTKNWLTRLLEVIRSEDVGAVGSKLVYPDGTLQEAGAIIWSDGTASNYGCGDDPEKPEYNYIREVDYCSGACLLVKKELFNKVEGFDKRFNPGYCEESDFCMTLRNLGYKVMYQPASMVVHFGRVTFGDSIKKYQAINEQKLREKWNTALPKDYYHPASAILFLARDRSRGQRILFIDRSVPTYDKDAGSLTTYSYLKLLSEMGFRITFIPDDQVKLMPYTMELQQMGIEVLYGDFDFEGWLKEFGKFIDFAWLTRPLTSIKYLDRIRQKSRARVIYYTQDLHYLREQRRYEVEKNKGALEQVTMLKQLEFDILGKADVILTPSSIEKEIILRELPGKYVEVIPACIFFKDLAEEVIPFDSRNDILFLGGFAHPPNVDAVTFLTNEIFPLIKQELPKVCLYVLGNNPPRRVLKLKSNDIKVIGYVKDLSPYFENCRIFVSPLRYGSGFKVKILTSMSYGLPVVTTTIGAEGMGLTEGENVLIADTSQEFARKVIGLYNDKTLWNRISKNSIKYCKEHFTYKMAKMKLEEVLTEANVYPIYPIVAVE
jgi:glycosyltransferase involved in cell wall biosynthesis